LGTARRASTSLAGAKSLDGHLKNIRVIIITGLSGSGKSTVAKALEDIGFVCVDNLPVNLLPRFLEIMNTQGCDNTRVALVMDTRSRDFLEEYGRVFRQVEESGILLEILFLEALDDVLVNRFKTTRRVHPVLSGESVRDSIMLERKKFQEIRHKAHWVLDTSTLTDHQLKELIVKRFSDLAEGARMVIDLLSFGYKYQIPPEADLVFDIRFLPNPFFDPQLKGCTGLEEKVARYVLDNPITCQFLERLTGFMEFLLPLYQKEGKAYLTVALGCTGGKHRSVVIVNHLEGELRKKGFMVRTRHRDVDKV
jgi:UPF0042 nucleotide-binding protein